MPSLATAAVIASAWLCGGCSLPAAKPTGSIPAPPMCIVMHRAGGDVAHPFSYRVQLMPGDTLLYTGVNGVRHLGEWKARAPAGTFATLATFVADPSLEPLSAQDASGTDLDLLWPDHVAATHRMGTALSRTPVPLSFFSIQGALDDAVRKATQWHLEAAPPKSPWVRRNDARDTG